MAPLLRAIGTLTLALPAILLSGCAGTADGGCEEWGARVEAVKVCNSRGMNCSIQQQTVEYCARTSRQGAAPAGAPGGKAPAAARVQPREAQATQAPEKPPPALAEPERAPAAKKTGKADKTGMPNLTPFWESLFSASRYPGLQYGKVKRTAMSPTTTPASSAGVEAALKTRARSVVSMQIASDNRVTPMDHRLDVVVYRAHNREAAVALYTVMMNDEWRDKKSQTQPGVTFAIVKTDDKNNPGGGGQRIYLQRGSYVVEVDEWKSIYRDAAGKPVPGKQFPHTRPISPNVVAKAVTQTFPAE